MLLADKVRSLVGRNRAGSVGGPFSSCPISALAWLCSSSMRSQPIPKEQMSLVRFRMKRSVPFDVESAAISFHPQQTSKKKGAEVVVVAAALEIMARYEAPFRAAGLHPGIVTTSGIAMLNLERRPEISVLARMSGRVLTVIVLQSGVLKLMRTVELADTSHDELLAVLFPTMAFIEDQYQAKPERVLFCGLGDVDGWEAELGRRSKS